MSLHSEPTMFNQQIQLVQLVHSGSSFCVCTRLCLRDERLHLTWCNFPVVKGNRKGSYSRLFRLTSRLGRSFSLNSSARPEISYGTILDWITTTTFQRLLPHFKMNKMETQSFDRLGSRKSIMVVMCLLVLIGISIHLYALFFLPCYQSPSLVLNQ